MHINNCYARRPRSHKRIKLIAHADQESPSSTSLPLLLSGIIKEGKPHIKLAVRNKYTCIKRNLGFHQRALSLHETRTTRTFMIGQRHLSDFLKSLVNVC